MAQNDKKLCLSHSIFQEAYMMKHDDICSNSIFFGCYGGDKRQKMTHNYQFQYVTISRNVDRIIKIFDTKV